MPVSPGGGPETRCWSASTTLKGRPTTTCPRSRSSTAEGVTRGRVASEAHSPSFPPSAPTESTMIITELSIENVKRLQALRICPETGKPVVITGDNGQGKSSILDAIELALTNSGLEDPIRHGAKRAV